MDEARPPQLPLQHGMHPLVTYPPSPDTPTQSGNNFMAGVEFLVHRMGNDSHQLKDLLFQFYARNEYVEGEVKRKDEIVHRQSVEIAKLMLDGNKSREDIARLEWERNEAAILHGRKLDNLVHTHAGNLEQAVQEAKLEVEKKWEEEVAKLNATVQHEKDKYDEEVNKLNVQVKSLQDEVTNIKASSVELQNDKCALQESNEALKRDVEKQERRREELEQQIDAEDALGQENEKQKVEIEELQSAKADLFAQLAEAKKDAQRHASRLDDAEQEKKALQSQRAELETRLAEAEANVTKLEDDGRDFITQSELYKGLYETAQQALEDDEGRKKEAEELDTKKIRLGEVELELANLRDQFDRANQQHWDEAGDLRKKSIGLMDQLSTAKNNLARQEQLYKQEKERGNVSERKREQEQGEVRRLEKLVQTQTEAANRIGEELTALKDSLNTAKTALKNEKISHQRSRGEVDVAERNAAVHFGAKVKLEADLERTKREAKDKVDDLTKQLELARKQPQALQLHLDQTREKLKECGGKLEQSEKRREESENRMEQAVEKLGRSEKRRQELEEEMVYFNPLISAARQVAGGRGTPETPSRKHARDGESRERDVGCDRGTSSAKKPRRYPDSDVGASRGNYDRSPYHNSPRKWRKP